MTRVNDAREELSQAEGELVAVIIATQIRTD